MESFEDFNPVDLTHRKVEDLPEVAQPHYSNVDGGFVEKEVSESDRKAQETAYQNKIKGTGPSHPLDVLHEEAINLQETKEKILEYIRIYVSGNLRSDEKDSHKGALIAPFFPSSLGTFPFYKERTPKGIEPIFRDLAFYKEAIQITPFVLESASPEIKNNKEIALSAVSIDGTSIQFVSPRLQEDPDVVVAALQQTPKAIKFISEAGLDGVIDLDEKKSKLLS